MSEEESKQVIENYFNYECTKRLISPFEILAIRKILDLYEKEKEENRKLRKCHLIYEEMTGIDLLL